MNLFLLLVIIPLSSSRKANPKSLTWIKQKFRKDEKNTDTNLGRTGIYALQSQLCKMSETMRKSTLQSLKSNYACFDSQIRMQRSTSAFDNNNPFLIPSKLCRFWQQKNKRISLFPYQPQSTDTQKIMTISTSIKENEYLPIVSFFNKCFDKINVNSSFGLSTP